MIDRVPRDHLSHLQAERCAELRPGCIILERYIIGKSGKIALGSADEGIELSSMDSGLERFSFIRLYDYI